MGDRPCFAIWDSRSCHEAGPSSPRRITNARSKQGDSTSKDVTFLGRGLGEPSAGPAALAYGAVLGLVAGLVALAASYVVVEATATGGDRREVAAGAPWVLATVQAALPLAACAPVALALQAVL